MILGKDDVNGEMHNVNPKVNEKVLVKTQPMSDAEKGITAKFM